jgi:hypothetical protein
LHSSGFTITVLHVHWRIFKLNRNSAIRLAAALLVAAPVAAAPGDMSVSTFLAKADALKTKGILALGSSDIKLLQSEGKAAGAAYRERIKKDLAQKRTPHSCPPAKANVKSDDFIAHLRTYPAAARPSISVAAAMADFMKKRYPCT